MNPFDPEYKDNSADQVTEIMGEGTVHTTDCDHEWGYVESDPLSDLVSVACNRCWQGASINPRTTELKDGKMISKEFNGEPI